MTDKIHVLHVVGAMDIGGIENMLMTLMPYMREKGIIFDFAVHGDTVGVYEYEIKKIGGTVYHLPKFIGVNVISYLSAWRALLINHPELKIIHGHMTSTASIYLWIAKHYGRITIAHSHSTNTSGGRCVYAIKRIMEFPLRYISDFLCACSEDAANYRFGKGTSKRGNYHLWHNAIDTKKFLFSQEKRNEFRKKLGISECTIVIGHTGRMVSSKNHEFLLNIFAYYKRNHSNCKLLLVGGGPLFKDIKKISEKLGVGSDVIFTGSVMNPADYLSAIDVFCYPSLYEGLSVSLIEAQINGRLCLASNVIPHEVVISNLIKFLSLSRSASDWASEIDKMRKEKNIGKIIYSTYDVGRVSRNVEKLYRKMGV